MESGEKDVLLRVSGHLATREFHHQLTGHQEKVVEVN